MVAMMDRWVNIVILVALFTAMITQVRAEDSRDCSQNHGSIGAKYQVEKDGKISTFSLWRQQNRVAIQHHKQGVTELWERLPNQQIRLIRAFDHYQRAIEYQPNEVKLRNAEVTWQKKYQILPNAFLKRMTLRGSQGTGCQLTLYYRYQHQHVTADIAWLKSWQLPSKQTIKRGRDTETITLIEKVLGSKKVNAVFSALDDYDMMDYADIGDNESDPFLAKMLRLGYMPHGGSGFDDEQGRATVRGHHHH